jgi:hypothetical protein
MGGGEGDKEGGLRSEAGKRRSQSGDLGKLCSKQALLLGFLMLVSKSEKPADKLSSVAHFSRALSEKTLRWDKL